MLRIIRTTTLDTLRADSAALPAVREERDQAKQEAALATDSAIRAETVAEQQLRELARAHVARLQAERERDTARTELEETRKELDAARAQVLLDAEDRVTLRKLLRTARRSETRMDRVYVLFRQGAFHSVHATAEAAEIAAEEEGAPRSGWTSTAPGAALPPASEVAWRIQALPLGGMDPQAPRPRSEEPVPTGQ
ncbi:hypothetical protein SUDANB58_05771 (plasmid) [Streptomyces sp. enrichment culture]|uniref:hypothetical protein n=1 Tax=Streptomyces sp. enrichment culture TaxID=1795815 RepID=UPI003F56C382